MMIPWNDCPICHKPLRLKIRELHDLEIWFNCKRNHYRVSFLKSAHSKENYLLYYEKIFFPKIYLYRRRNADDDNTWYVYNRKHGLITKLPSSNKIYSMTIERLKSLVMIA